MPGILLCGFEPWAEFETNPSGEVARALGGHVLSVDYRRADAALRRLLKSKPSAVVLTGLAAGRKAVEIETVAHNLDDAGSRKRRRIEPRGPRRRMSSLPVDHLLRVLRKAGFPARRSKDAGRFLCNHVFYVARGMTEAPCGFIHLPPTSVLPLRKQIQALRLVLKTLREPPAGALARKGTG